MFAFDKLGKNPRIVKVRYIYKGKGTPNVYSEDIMVLCPICEQGYLTEITEKSNDVELEYSCCSYCLAKTTNAEQAERNKEKMIKKCFTKEDV